jgi:hypothetical protein
VVGAGCQAADAATPVRQLDARWLQLVLQLPCAQLPAGACPPAVQHRRLLPLLPLRCVLLRPCRRVLLGSRCEFWLQPCGI